VVSSLEVLLSTFLCIFHARYMSCPSRPSWFNYIAYYADFTLSRYFLSLCTAF
jgi:hypothetical protein